MDCHHVQIYTTQASVEMYDNDVECLFSMLIPGRMRVSWGKDSTSLLLYDKGAFQCFLYW